MKNPVVRSQSPSFILGSVVTALILVLLSGKFIPIPFGTHQGGLTAAFLVAGVLFFGFGMAVVLKLGLDRFRQKK